MSAERARVQGEATNCRRGHKPYGSVAWAEHVEAWEAYHRLHWQQDAEMINSRGGFSYWEMTDLLGHEPTTWQPTTWQPTRPAPSGEATEPTTTDRGE